MESHSAVNQRSLRFRKHMLLSYLVELLVVELVQRMIIRQG
jgi:hypothetical protein